MRSGGQEFHADSRTFIPGFTQEDDPAFLLFLCLRVDENEHFAVIDLVAQVQQASVGADDQRLADFQEFPALMTAAQGLQTHPVEDALAAALRGLSQFCHGLIMAFPLKGVNCPFGQVFPLGKVLCFPQFASNLCGLRPGRRMK
jgi:hypothetical protein